MNRLIAIIIALLPALLLPLRTSAWEAEAYAQTSKLATGRWMKVRVPSDGLYYISASTLRSWGFGDLSRVRICGYGGRRLPQILDRSTYTDDIPEVQTFTTSTGIIFYGLGAGEWSADGTYYLQNDYSDYGYYFVGERTEGEPAAPETVDATGPVSDAATTFTDRVHHELEQICVPGEAGPLLLGEDFRYTSARLRIA